MLIDLAIIRRFLDGGGGGGRKGGGGGGGRKGGGGGGEKRGWGAVGSWDPPLFKGQTLLKARHWGLARLETSLEWFSDSEDIYILNDSVACVSYVASVAIEILDILGGK